MNTPPPGIVLQVVGDHRPQGDFNRLALGIFCPPCDRGRTLVLNDTIALVTERNVAAISVQGTCHCGYTTRVDLGWHDNVPGYSGRVIEGLEGGVVVEDDAGICPGDCGRTS